MEAGHSQAGRERGVAVTQVAVQLSVARGRTPNGFLRMDQMGAWEEESVSGKVSGLRDWKDIYGDRKGCRMAGLGREMEISDEIC